MVFDDAVALADLADEGLYLEPSEYRVARRVVAMRQAELFSYAPGEVPIPAFERMANDFYIELHSRLDHARVAAEGVS